MFYNIIDGHDQRLKEILAKLYVTIDVEDSPNIIVITREDLSYLLEMIDNFMERDEDFID